MITINNISETVFSYNGIAYFKNFTPFVTGNKVSLLNTYDGCIALTPEPTLFSDITLDGVVYSNIQDLQTALLPVVYLKKTITNWGDIGGDINNQTDLIALTDSIYQYAAAIDADRTAFQNVFNARLGVFEKSWENIAGQCTFGGWSVITTAIVNAYILNDKVAFIQFELVGTSNAISASITFPALYTALSRTEIVVKYNTGTSPSSAYGTIPVNSNVLSFGQSSGGFSATGAKNISGIIFFKIA